MKWVMFSILVTWVVVSPWVLVYGCPPEYTTGDGGYVIAYISQRVAMGLVVIFISSVILGYRLVWVSILGMLLGLHMVARAIREENRHNELVRSN